MNEARARAEMEAEDARALSDSGGVTLTSQVDGAVNAIALGLRCDRALSRTPSRTIQIQAHPFLSAAYGQMGRNQDAEG